MSAIRSVYTQVRILAQVCLGALLAAAGVGLLVSPALALDLPSLPNPPPPPGLPSPPSVTVPSPSIPALPSLPVTVPSLPVVPGVAVGQGDGPPPASYPSPAQSEQQPAPQPGAGAADARASRPVGAAQSPASGSWPGLRWVNDAIASPFGPALIAAIAVLPLLLAIWLLAAARTWLAARRRKDAHLRLALAGELGIRTRALTDMGADDLMKLRDQVTFDDLTGVLRRAAGVAAVEREMSRARRQRTPLTAVFVDVDGLKATNDTQGHAAGDRLLRNVASSLRDGLRGQDLVFRYGGDEFVCVAVETGIFQAETLFSRLRQTAADGGIGITVGMAELKNDDDIVSFLARADEDLYRRRAELGINGRQPGRGVVPLPTGGRRARQRPRAIPLQ